MLGRIKWGTWSISRRPFSTPHINKDQPELHDLSKDPTELNDLAATDPARLTQMITAWNKWATRVGVPAERQLALP